MNKRVLGILFAVLFIVMVGFSILFPVEPFYIERYGATARTMGWLMATYSLMQFMFSPIWGRISDHMGRKPVMMIGLTGFAGAMVLFGLSQSIPMFFVARGLAGVLSAATLPTAMAVIADTTTEKNRTRGMGVLGAAFGLGVIFGPFIGGVLGERNLSLPFFVAAGLSVLTMIAVLLFLPETLGRHDDSVGTQDGSRWAALTHETASLYGLAFVVTFSLAGLEATFPFMADSRLGLDTGQVGYVYAIMGLAGAAVQGGLVGPIQKLLGEKNMLYAGLGVSAIGMFGLAVAPRAWIAAAALSTFAAGHGLIRPANVSLVSQKAPTGHGLAIGLLDSMDSLGRIIGPVVGGFLYSFRDALPFVSGGIVNVVALVAASVLLARMTIGSREASPEGSITN